MADHTPHNNPNALPGRVLAPMAGGGQDVDEGPNILGFLAALRRNLWLVLLFGVVGVGLTALALARSERLFASRAVIQLPDQQSAGGGGGLAGLAATLTGGGGSLASQVQVISSRLLVGQLVDSLGLRLHRKVPGVIRPLSRPVGYVDQVEIAPELDAGSVDLQFGADGVVARFADAEARAAYGEPIVLPGLRFVVPVRPAMEELELTIVHRDGAIDAVLEELNVFVREGTNLIDIVVAGYDPFITQRIADASAVLYQEFAAQRTRTQAERQRQFVFDQLKMTEDSLRYTQDQLTEFRQREGLYSSRSQAIMDQTGQTELELRYAELAAEHQIYRLFMQRLREGESAARAEVFRAIVSSPSIRANLVLMSSYEALTKFQQQRDSLTTGGAAYAPGHPDVQRLDSLIAYSEADLLALTEAHIQSLEAQLAATTMVRERVDSAFQHLAENEPEELRLILRLEAITEAAMQLRERYYSAGIAEAGIIEQVTILDHALPGGPTGTGPVRSLFLGLLLGLLVGSAGALVLDNMSGAIRKRDELERVLRVPGLGVIPPIASATAGKPKLKLPAAIWNGNGAGGPAARELVAANEVHSAGAEAYRTLRTNLLFAQPARPPRSIMVTSPSNGEGKTMTAANLAVTFAHQRRRVLLVDADLRRPRLHTLFDLPKEPGLGELLRHSEPAFDAIRETAIPGLHLLAAGGVLPVSAADLVGGEVVRRLLDELGGDFDIIIVDSPPVLLTADAPILATQVDGVLLVVKAGQTERETAQYALHQLTSVGAHVLGAVLNDPDAMLTGTSAYSTGAYTPV